MREEQQSYKAVQMTEFKKDREMQTFHAKLLVVSIET